MSDSLRQDTSDKIGSAAKPDSQKSTAEYAGDHVKGAMDSAASYLQPQHQKTTTQKTTDAVYPDNTNASTGHQGEGLMSQAGQAIDHVSKQTSHAFGLDKK